MRLDEIGWDWMGLDKIGQDRIRLECSKWPLCMGLVSNVGNLAIKRETISKIFLPLLVLENGLQKALELDIWFVHSGQGGWGSAAGGQCVWVCFVQCRKLGHKKCDSFPKFPLPVLEDGLQRALELDIQFMHVDYFLYSLIQAVIWRFPQLFSL